MTRQTRRGSTDRGAVLIQTAIAMIGLMGFSAFAIDYGVLWSARRQAQNAADAAAMAGAISMGFVDMDDQARARQSALDAAALNLVWGEPPDVRPTDVTFPVCPPGSPGEGTNACIRVDVFRNQRAGGNPLPTFFGQLVGVAEQGVRATATAEVLFGDSTDCVKPWAIADKWIENRDDQAPPGWSEDDRFDRYRRNGDGELLAGAVDYYERPGAPGGAYGPSGTGFTRDSVALGGSDYGRLLVLNRHAGGGNSDQVIAPGWYQAVQLTPGEAGRDRYREDIAECNPTVIGPGTVLETQPGAGVGPTRQGMQDLYDQDPEARWDPSMNGGRGGIRGGCMADGTCAMSPRLVAIPVYDPDQFQYEGSLPGSNRFISIVKIIGFFLEDVRGGGEVVGHVMTYPSVPRGTTSETPGASFVVSFALVR